MALQVWEVRATLVLPALILPNLVLPILVLSTLQVFLILLVVQSLECHHKFL